MSAAASAAGAAELRKAASESTGPAESIFLSQIALLEWQHMLSAALCMLGRHTLSCRKLAGQPSSCLELCVHPPSKICVLPALCMCRWFQNFSAPRKEEREHVYITPSHAHQRVLPSGAGGSVRGLVYARICTDARPRPGQPLFRVRVQCAPGEECSVLATSIYTFRSFADTAIRAIDPDSRSTFSLK